MLSGTGRIALPIVVPTTAPITLPIVVLTTWVHQPSQRGSKGLTTFRSRPKLSLVNRLRCIGLPKEVWDAPPVSEADLNSTPTTACGAQLPKKIRRVSLVLARPTRPAESVACDEHTRRGHIGSYPLIGTANGRLTTHVKIVFSIKIGRNLCQPTVGHRQNGGPRQWDVSERKRDDEHQSY